MLTFVVILVSFLANVWMSAAQPPYQCYLTHNEVCTGKYPMYRYNIWNSRCESYHYSGCPPDLWNNFKTLEECKRIAYPVCRGFRNLNGTIEEGAKSDGSTNDGTNTRRSNTGGENPDIFDEEIDNTEETLKESNLSRREKLLLAKSTTKVKRCTQKCHNDALRSLLE